MRHALGFCFVLLLMSSAHAAGPSHGPEDLGLAYETAVKGDAQPALVLRPRTALKQVTMTIRDTAGAEQVLRVGALRAGATRRVPFALGSGRASYQGTIALTWGDGKPAEYTFEFDAVRYQALSLDLTWQDVDLARRTITLHPSHAIAKVELVLEDRHGRELATHSQVFDPPLGDGEAVTITWPETTQPERLSLKATDALGVWASTKIVPFTIDIPHDEVQFALGQAGIAPSEVPKLEKTLDDLRRALREHGTLLDLKLFIAGFTDTVGDSASNRALSLRRAAAIASWFKQRGVRLAIFYRGFGEDALAVPTPDETDEAKNRRALYILSVHPPLGVQVAGGGWAAL